MRVEHNISIEAKCTGQSEKSLVNISHYNQLKWEFANPKTILSVVRCSSSASFSEHPTLPEILHEAIENMKKDNPKIGLLMFKAIKKKLPVDIFNSEIKTRFFTRYDVKSLSIEYHVIEENDSADLMAKQNNIPSGVTIDAYRIDPHVLKNYIFKL